MRSKRLNKVNVAVRHMAFGDRAIALDVLPISRAIQRRRHGSGAGLKLFNPGAHMAQLIRDAGHIIGFRHGDAATAHG